MTEKTKRIILVTVCCLLCEAAVIGIATRFGGNAEIPSGVVSDNQPESGDLTVDINGDQTGTIPGTDPDKQNDVDIQVQVPDKSNTDPAQGADSSGEEQTIQADPVKPEAPEKPEAPTGTTTLPDDHDAEDVPDEERKTEDEKPPVYEEPPTTPPAATDPPAGSTNSSGQVYVPGFGYVDNSGENHGGTLDDMYENGNKIGIMGGN